MLNAKNDQAPRRASQRVGHVLKAETSSKGLVYVTIIQNPIKFTKNAFFDKKCNRNWIAGLTDLKVVELFAYNYVDLQKLSATMIRCGEMSTN